MASRIKGITIELDGDTKGLDKALSDVNSRSSQLQKELRDVNRLLKFNPGNAELIAQKQKLLAEQVENTREKLKRLQAAQADVDRQFAEGKINEEQYRAFQRELTETESKLKHLEGQLASTQSKFTEFGEKATAAGQSFKKVGASMTSAGKELSTKVTLPLVGLAAAAVKVGMDFEQSMSNVAAISGATGKEFKALEDKAIEMGGSTNKSASEAADAMSYMALAGWDTKQMIAGIEPILKLSSAGNIDLARTSDLVTDAMSALRIEVSDLPGFLDMVAKASQKSNTDIDKLMEAFLVAGGTMAAFNVPLEESTAVLGVMANRGFKGAEAGTALNAIFTNLTSGLGASGKALKEMGISSFDAEGNFRGLETVLFDVKEKLAGMNEEQQATYMAMIAGKEHGKTFQSLLDGLGNEYGDFKDEVSNATGALQKMYEVMTDNAKGRWDTFTSSLEKAGIAIFKNLQPALESLLGFLQGLADKFNNLSPTMQNAIVVIAGIAAAIGPILVVLGTLVGAIGALLIAFGTISSAIGVVTTGVAAATPAVGALASIFAFLTGPIGLAIAAIVAIGIALVAAYAKFEGFREVVHSVFDAVKSAVMTALNAVVSFIQEKLSYIQQFWTENGAQIKQAAENVWNGILAIIQFVMPAIEAVITLVWKAVQIVVMSIWDNIKGVISGALDIILGLVKTFSALFTGDWQGVWDGVKQIFSGAIELLWNAVQLMLWGKLLKGLAVFAGTFKTAVTAMWSAVKGSFTTAINAIKTFFTAGFNAMKTSGTTIMNGIKTVISTVWNAIKTIFTTVINAVKSAVTSGFNLIRSTITNVMNGIRSLISSVWNSIKSTITNVVNNIKSAVSSGFSGVASAIKTKMAEAVSAVATKMVEMLGKVTGKASEFLSAGKDLIRGLINGIKEMGADAVAAITGVVDSVVNKAKSLLGIKSPSRVFKAIGEFTGEGLAIGIASTKDKANDAISGVMQVITKTTKTNAQEVTKIATEAEKQRTAIQKEYAQKRAELSRKTALSSQSALKTHKNKKGQIVTTGEEKVYKIRQEASIKLQKLNQDEQAKLSKIHDKMQADIQKKEAALSKQRLDAIKLFIEDKKSLEQLSIVDEALIWQKAVDSFTAGTKEKVESQKAYAKALDEVNKEITTVNSKYANAMQKINDDFQKSEEDLTKKYQDSLQSRTDALKNFAGMFDEFDIKTDKSGAILLDNLTNQVDGFKTWQKEIEKLAKRAIDDGLLAELKAMGPKALGELMALNTMSDQQLSKYSSLYKEKSALAREQAEAELVGMKKDTEKQISELREAANKELSALQSDWQKELKSLSNNTSTELSSLKKIGVDAVKGLIEGIKSMHPDLQAVAQELADTVSETVKSALDIHSPSRVFMSIGSFITEGLSIGIMNSSQKAYSAINKVTSKIVSEAREIITRGTSETNDHVKKLEKEFAADSIKIKENYNNDIAHIHQVASIYARELTEGEKNQILELERNSAEAIERLKIQTGKTIASILEQDNSNRLSQLKSFLADKKKEEEISALDEARIWDEAVKSFAAGTAAKIEAQKEYEKQLKIVNDEIVKVNTDYANKIKTINDDLKKSEESLTQAYETEVGNRANALNSFAGLFDAFNINVEKSGDELLGNLKGQVDGFKTWQEQIELLAGKPIDIELLEELREMGPKALPELLALNSMTEQQLTEYSNLYKEKAKLARLQAENELEGMKVDTAKRIDELRQTASDELDILTKEWTSKIANLTDKTDEEFGSLNQVGVNAGKNLLDGLASMESSLVAKAKAIAQAVNDALQSALGGSATIDMPTIPQARSLSANGTTNNTTNNSPTIVNNYYQPVDRPSELARKQTQNMRDLATQW